MNIVIPSANIKMPKPSWYWYALVTALVLGKVFLQLQSNVYTLLLPQNHDILYACLLIGTLLSLVLACVIYKKLAGACLHRLITSGVFFLICAVLINLLYSRPIADLVCDQVHFSAKDTRRFEAYFPIEQAWHDLGITGENWLIKNKNLQTPINISEVDYQDLALKAQLGMGWNAPDKMQIGSLGQVFCAKVILDQSNEALRVVNNGIEGEIPSGSIIPCPAAALGKRYLEYHPTR